MGESERFTQRGFENFAKFVDTHCNLIVVRESSQVGEPCVWIFSRANDDVAGLYTAPYLNAAQCRTLAAALMAFADKVEAGESDGDLEVNRRRNNFGDFSWACE